MARFARPFLEDYIRITIGRELGAWDSVLHWRNTWNGSFSDYFLSGLLAPLDTALPAILELAIIVIWLAAATFLIHEVLTRLSLPGSLLHFALPLAALTVAATIDSLDLRSFYWLSASLRYALPMAILTVFLTLVARIERRGTSHRLMALSIAASAVCFVNAGFSEMFLLVQLGILTLAMAGAVILRNRAARAPYLFAFGFGWLGTVAALGVQITAPGVRIRLGNPARFSIGTPVRELPELLRQAIQAAFDLMIHTEIFIAIMLLFFAGLLTALALYRANSGQATPQAFKLTAPPLAFGLLTQLLLMPSLWAHTSDQAQLLGRFSLGYFIVISLNLAFIFAFAGLILGRKQISMALSLHKHGAIGFAAVMLLIILALFLLTQARSIHHLAYGFLLATTLSLVLVLAWTLTPAGQNRLLLWALLIWLVVAGFLVMVFMPGLYTTGDALERITIPIVFMQALSGLMWGLTVGVFLRIQFRWQADWLVYAAATACVVVGLACVYSQMSRLPGIQTYAREWDDRHRRILQAKAEGKGEIELPQFTYYYNEHESTLGNRNFPIVADYYEVDQVYCTPERCYVVIDSIDD